MHIDEKPSVYDIERQELHWKAHKEDCKARATAAELMGVSVFFCLNLTILYGSVRVANANIVEIL